jgi:hypothetical protein
MRAMIERVELRPQSATESLRFAWSGGSRRLDGVVEGATAIPVSDAVGEPPLTLEPTTSG